MESTDYESALGVASQVSDLLMRRRYQDFSAEADVVVRPDLGRHSSTDYSDFDTLIRRAYEATVASLPAIRGKAWPRPACRTSCRIQRRPPGPRSKEPPSPPCASRAAKTSANGWRAGPSTSPSVLPSP
jgi:hypothetical protein